MTSENMIKEPSIEEYIFIPPNDLPFLKLLFWLRLG